MKTVRIREKIKKFLGDRPRNTAEILEHINSTMRHGTTVSNSETFYQKTRTLSRLDTSSAPAFSQADTTFVSGPQEHGSLTTAQDGKKDSL